MMKHRFCEADLFIGNLSQAATRPQIAILLKRVGFPLEDVSIKHSRSARATAFVKLKDSSRKAEAVAKLNGVYLCGEPITVRLYVPYRQKTERPPRPVPELAPLTPDWLTTA